jgi:hypothetical protein
LAKAPHPPLGAGLGRGEAGKASKAGEEAGLAVGDAGEALGLDAGEALGLGPGEADELAAGHDGCPGQT